MLLDLHGLKLCCFHSNLSLFFLSVFSDETSKDINQVIKKQKITRTLKNAMAIKLMMKVSSLLRERITWVCLWQFNNTLGVLFCLLFSIIEITKNNNETKIFWFSFAFVTNDMPRKKMVCLKLERNTWVA